MQRLVKVMALVLPVLVAPVAALGAPRAVGATPTVLVAVDSVAVNGTTLVVVGVVEGEAGPSEWGIAMSYSSADSTPAYGQLEACQRLALLAMSKPGAFRLSLRKPDAWAAPVCTLARVVP